jgi:hypothetical protein
MPRGGSLESVRQERDVAGREPQLVSGVNLGPFLDASIVDPGAVARAEILDPDVVSLSIKAGVLARKEAVFDDEIRLGHSTDGDRFVNQWNLEILSLAREHS